MSFFSRFPSALRCAASRGLLAAAILLTGCGAALKNYPNHPELARKVETTDPVELQRRWGGYLDAVGKYWAGKSSTPQFLYMQWKVPGASLERLLSFCGHTLTGDKCLTQRQLIEYHPDIDKLSFHMENALGLVIMGEVLTVNESGVIKGHTYAFRPQDIYYDKASGEWQDLDASVIGPVIRFTSVSEAQFRAMYGEARANQAEEDRRSSAFWGAVAQGVLAGTQSAAQAYSAQEAARPGGPTAAQRELAAIQERERLATQAAASRKAPASSTMARATAPGPAPVRPATQSQSVVVAAAVPTPSRQAEPAKPETSGPKRIAFPEAIFVCTKPNETGNFRCASPVTAGLSGGPKNGLPEWTTPERMVNAMSDACPEPRRLASSTHLVWGCGFGATNNSNSMDRSAGVDVAGRRTFYCGERETSCRHSEP